LVPDHQLFSFSILLDLTNIIPQAQFPNCRPDTRAENPPASKFTQALHYVAQRNAYVADLRF
jgi:hypothetical protein